VLISKNARNFNYLSNETNALKITDVRQLNEGQLAFVGNRAFYEFDPKTNHTQNRFDNIERHFRFTQDSKNQLWFATLTQGVQKFIPPVQRTPPMVLITLLPVDLAPTRYLILLQVLTALFGQATVGLAKLT
jgi:hypothetical protein